MTPADRLEPKFVGESFTTSFPPCNASLAPARRSFSDWLHRRADDDVADELEVVFSELAANAVHGSPTGADEVTTRAWYEDDVVVIDITNRTGPSGPAESGWDLDDPLRTGGRGLVIAQAFVDSMEVTLDPGQSIVVRCRRRIG